MIISFKGSRTNPQNLTRFQIAPHGCTLYNLSNKNDLSYFLHFPNTKSYIHILIKDLLQVAQNIQFLHYGPDYFLCQLDLYLLPLLLGGAFCR